MATDELNGDLGILEEVWKNVTGGGVVPLRRNHSSDTFYTDYAHAAKSWMMNWGDVPHVPNAARRRKP